MRKKLHIGLSLSPVCQLTFVGTFGPCAIACMGAPSCLFVRGTSPGSQTPEL